MNKRQYPTFKKTFLYALALLAFLSCIPSPAAVKADAGVPVTGVNMGSLAKLELIIGQTKRIYTTIYPHEATERGLSWHSSDESIASVESGVVTGISKGKTVITVKTVDGGFTDKCEVVVSEPPKGVMFDWESVRLCPGDTTAIKYYLNPSGNAPLVWSSDNDSVATAENGIVTAHSLGIANITASTPDKKYSASCEVGVMATEIESDYYTIDREKGELAGVAKSTYAGQLRAYLNNNGSDLAIFNADGTVYRGMAVATGMTVKLIVFSKLRETLKIVVSGDCNGDGEVSEMDYTLARLHALGFAVLKDEYFTAGDVNGDGAITAADYTLIRLDAQGVKPLLSGIPDLPEVTDSHIRTFIDTAFAQRGKPYYWGVEGPDNFDCSGFVYYCLRKAGCGVGRTTAHKYSKRKSWQKVSKDNLKPGDLMFFRDEDNPRKIGHIGVYLGNGYMIHATPQYGGVVISAVNGSYAETLSHGRRVWR